MHAISGWRRPELAAHLDAVTVGQTHVEHGDVRSCRRDPGDRLGRGTCLARHDEVVLGLDHLPQATPDDLVIVE